MKTILMSDAFLILPGGLGTLDEFFEIFTWGQLKLLGPREKPIYLYNFNGFYSELIKHLHKCVSEGFLQDTQLQRLRTIEKMEELL